MGFFLSNLGWIIALLFVIGTFLFKKITKNPDVLTSKFMTNRVIKVQPDTSLNLIKEALENARFQKVGLDIPDNRVYAQTRFSMSSWSEYIEVRVQTNTEQTTLKFKSICALPTQIFDWGKNKRNYKKFEKELNKLLSLN